MLGRFNRETTFGLCFVKGVFWLAVKIKGRVNVVLRLPRQYSNTIWHNFVLKGKQSPKLQAPSKFWASRGKILHVYLPSLPIKRNSKIYYMY